MPEEHVDFKNIQGVVVWEIPKILKIKTWFLTLIVYYKKFVRRYGGIALIALDKLKKIISAGSKILKDI